MSGSSGSTGATGTSGVSGVSGSTGSSGGTGLSGTSGGSGSTGSTGFTGQSGGTGGSGSSGSSRSSSTTTSRSSSSSSSSSSTVSGRYVRWRPNGPNRKIKFEELSRFATRKFRDQSEVVAFAASHPGALSGFFFSVSCYRRAHQGLMTKTRDLRHQSVVTWVANHSGLTETRDRREALTLAMAMDAINSKQLAYAMDVLSQRIQSIQAAKTKNGSWEKSQRTELAVEPGAIASSSGMLRLTA